MLALLLFAPDALAYGPEDLHIPSDAEALVYGISGEGRSLTAYRFGSGTNVTVLGFAIHGCEDRWQRDGEALVYTAGKAARAMAQFMQSVKGSGQNVPTSGKPLNFPD